jgi:hypothetical protein
MRLPDPSNEGAIVLTTTANSTHLRMIGTANTCMAWAKNGRLACGTACVLLVSVVRTSPGKTSAR